ncbi:hypothetical protein LEP1GSC060_3394 [Leptospira weilii serovar Ranarum str. ICFT]|uniref:Uncharacterized protein n=1 Tax=Leptospira weilii serovar Ranarum str. ICFT TaxID=1218598 RepID=N1W9X9_9LEPT|nr:hypothetical protein LEP1GSC060_3394 [Leptospira weilii serovar Ranarum str. ICFT]
MTRMMSANGPIKKKNIFENCISNSDPFGIKIGIQFKGVNCI